uniref:Uncharacterized protein n=1 Tax=Clandestinovirus TaxID=2831644 RepID=A0A8F8KRP4_9VIRU|nr:hypothetical protein KOM_12_484 [Clandestinovirus]
MDSGFSFDDAKRIKQDRQEKMWKALEGVRSEIMATIRLNALAHRNNQCFVFIPEEMHDYPEYDTRIIALSMKKYLTEQGFRVSLDKNNATRMLVDWKNPDLDKPSSANTAMRLSMPLDHPQTITAKRILSEVISNIRESCYMGKFECYYRMSASDYDSPHEKERLLHWVIKHTKKRGFILQRTEDDALYWKM